MKKVRALTEVRHEKKTKPRGSVFELDDAAAQTLIDLKKVEEVKDTTTVAKLTTGEQK